jgi:hypothetical protein
MSDLFDDKSTLDANSRIEWRKGRGCVTANCREVILNKNRRGQERGDPRIIPPLKKRPKVCCFLLGRSKIMKGKCAVALIQTDLEWAFPFTGNKVHGTFVKGSIEHRLISDHPLPDSPIPD